MTTHPIPGGQPFPPSTRAANVDIGSLDFLSMLWRLIKMELYKLHHRLYSRVVLIILLAFMVFTVGLVGIFAHYKASAPLADFAPLQCSAQITTDCTTQPPTQAQLAHQKEADMQTDASLLGFPDSLNVVGEILSYNLVAMLGLLLLAPIIGTEYSLGTIRLLFTRGPTRLQCLLGKAFAGLIYTAEVLLLLVLTYSILGMLIYPLAGEPYSYIFGHFHSTNFGTMFGNALGLIAVTIVYWYAFVALAIFFGTLGRSTAAALGGAFAWFILEMLIPLITSLLMNTFAAGPVHNLLQALPNYLFFNNLSTLVHDREAILSGVSASATSDLHAVLVTGVYLVLLIGSSCLVTMRRDITN
ncbi:MAG TPA: ABC transporter permease [Ktedonosporobacter sp.]|nr:ABC transporter permease [Ktedonosporobacter sp.]